MTIGVYGSAAYALQCDTLLCRLAVSVDRERLFIKTCVIFVRKNSLVCCDLSRTSTPHGTSNGLFL